MDIENIKRITQQARTLAIEAKGLHQAPNKAVTIVQIITPLIHLLLEEKPEDTLGVLIMLDIEYKNTQAALATILRNIPVFDDTHCNEILAHIRTIRVPHLRSRITTPDLLRQKAKEIWDTWQVIMQDPVKLQQYEDLLPEIH